MNVKMESLEGMAKRVKRETIGKQETRRFLADVPPEYSFWCRDGRIIRNMKELSDALSIMTDETYGYHWNTEKKDFSNWVRDIIGDVNLARNLEGATSRSLAAWEVAARMAYLARR